MDVVTDTDPITGGILAGSVIKTRILDDIPQGCDAFQFHKEHHAMTIRRELGSDTRIILDSESRVGPEIMQDTDWAKLSGYVVILN